MSDLIQPAPEDQTPEIEKGIGVFAGRRFGREPELIRRRREGEQQTVAAAPELAPTAPSWPPPPPRFAALLDQQRQQGWGADQVEAPRSWGHNPAQPPPPPQAPTDDAELPLPPQWPSHVPPAATAPQVAPQAPAAPSRAVARAAPVVVAPQEQAAPPAGTYAAAQIQSGIESLRQIMPNATAASAASTLTAFDQIDRDLAAGRRFTPGNGNQRFTAEQERYGNLPPEQRAAVRQEYERRFGEALASSFSSQLRQGQLPVDPAARRFGEALDAKDWGGAWREFLSSPGALVQHYTLSNLATQLPILVAGGGAGVAFGRGAAALGALGTGWGVEAGTRMSERLRESLQAAGVDVNDVESVQRALATDRSLVLNAARQAGVEAIGPAIFDALSMRFAPSLRPRSSGVRGLAGSAARGAAGYVGETAGEMAGEAASQVLGGRPFNARDIIEEGMGAGSQTAVTTGIATALDKTNEATRASTLNPQTGERLAAFREAVRRGDTGAAGTAMAEAVRHLGLPPEVSTMVEDRLRNGQHDAEYLQGLIRFAMDTDWNLAPSRLFHEVIHAFHDKKLGLLGERERAALDRAADQWLQQPVSQETTRPGAAPRPGESNASYLARLNGVDAWEQHADPETHARNVAARRELLRKEAISHLGEVFLERQASPRTVAERAFERIGNFGRSIGQRLRGEGHQTSEDVFRSFLSGGRRQTNREMPDLGLQDRTQPAQASKRDQNLDRSPKARAARAEEQGYGERRYHGTSADVDFKGFRRKDRGVWTTTDPAEASEYAFNNDSQGHRLETGPRGVRYVPTNTASRVMPVRSRAQNVYEMTPEEMTKLRADAGDSPTGYMRAEAAYMRQKAAQGYDAVRMGPRIQIDLNPRNLRASHADFDPKRQNENDLLASRRDQGDAPWATTPPSGSARTASSRSASASNTRAASATDKNSSSPEARSSASPMASSPQRGQAGSSALPANTGSKRTKPVVVRINRMPIHIPPDVSDNFAREVIEAIKTMGSDKLMEVLYLDGTEVHLGSSAEKARPDLAGEHPRGYPDGATIANVQGFYEPASNKAWIFQNYRSLQSGDLVSSVNGGAVAKHELGHALDAALQRMSASTSFGAAWKRDTAAMPKRLFDDLKYFTENETETAARSEAFAEIVGTWSSSFLGGVMPTTRRTIQHATRDIIYGRNRPKVTMSAADQNHKKEIGRLDNLYGQQSITRWEIMTAAINRLDPERGHHRDLVEHNGAQVHRWVAAMTPNERAAYDKTGDLMQAIADRIDELSAQSDAAAKKFDEQVEALKKKHPQLVRADGRPVLASAREAPTSAAFQRWFKGSKVVDAEGRPLVVYHGTTHDFDAFDPRGANIENDFGAASYFTNNSDDVAINYAGYGPDLTGRIERMAEWIKEGDDFEGGHDEAMRIARERLSGHEGVTMPVYLAIKKPAVIGGPHPTMLTFREPYNWRTDTYGEPRGTLVKLAKAVRDAAFKYEDADGDGAFAALINLGHENDGTTIDEVVALLKSEQGGLIYAYDPDSEFSAMAVGEIIRRALEAAGFDGIIDHTVSKKFYHMKGMTRSTTHYLAFKPTQIKSAIGNSGKYSPRNPSILASARDATRSGAVPDTLSTGRATTTPASLPRDAQARLRRAEAMGFTTPAYHSTQNDFSRFDISAGEGFGVHVGTARAATDRARRQRGVDDYHPHTRVMPLRVKLGNTIELPDPGVWSHPDRIEAIWSHTPMPPMLRYHIDELLRDYREHVAAEAVHGTTPPWGKHSRTSILAQDWFAARLRQAFRDAGIDSVKYTNGVEDRGSTSYVILRPENIRSAFAEFNPWRAGEGDIMASAREPISIKPEPLPPGGDLRARRRAAKAIVQDVGRRHPEGVENAALGRRIKVGAPAAGKIASHASDAIIALLPHLDEALAAAVPYHTPTGPVADPGTVRVYHLSVTIDDGNTVEPYRFVVKEKNKTDLHLYDFGTRRGPKMDGQENVDGEPPTRPLASTRDPAFFSALTRSVEGMNQQKGPPQQWVGQINNLTQKGVKKEEIDWSGVIPWLQGQRGTITRDQVVEYLRASEPQIDEVVLEDEPKPKDTEGMKALLERRQRFRDARYEAAEKAADIINDRYGPSEIRRLGLGAPEFGETRTSARVMLNEIAQMADNPSRTGELGADYADAVRTAREAGEEINAINEEIADLQARRPNTQPTKYKQYTLPGGVNYRELVFTAPPSKPLDQGLHVVEEPTTWRAHSSNGRQGPMRLSEEEALADANRLQSSISGDTWDVERMVPRFAVRNGAGVAVTNERPASRDRAQAILNAMLAVAAGKASFTHPHWPDEKNPVAHTRTKDRLDVDGKRVLFVEEVQSDLHAEGSRVGYRPTEREIAAAHSAFPAAVAARDAAYTAGVDASVYGTPEQLSAAKEAHQRAADEVTRLERVIEQAADTRKPPAQPWPKSWPMFVMKRLLREAATGGYDRIGWTTGETQAERYNLSHHVARLEYDPKDNVLHIYDHNGRHHEEDVAQKDLPQYIGVELAERLRKEIKRWERDGGGWDRRDEYDAIAQKYDVIEYNPTEGYSVHEVDPSEDWSVQQRPGGAWAVVGPNDEVIAGDFDTEEEANEAFYDEANDKREWVVKDGDGDVVESGFTSERRAERFIEEEQDGEYGWRIEYDGDLEDRTYNTEERAREVIDRRIEEELDDMEAAANQRELPSLSDLDVTVGGETKGHLYDELLVNEMNKYLKRWGVRVRKGAVLADNGAEMRDHVGNMIPVERAGFRFTAEDTKRAVADLGWSTEAAWEVDITPEMRESVAKEQPLFSKRDKRERGYGARTDTPEFKRWFGSSKVVDENGRPLMVYHGTGRPDRVGARFRKSRATSGPMSYFTDDPRIGSNYAQNKADTSFDGDISFPEWFRVSIPGYRRPLALDQAWHFLPAEEKRRIAALAPRVSQDDEGNLILRPEGAKNGLGGYDQHIKEARGNHLKALLAEWVESAVLFNKEEEAFPEVLRLAGMTTPFTMRNPSATDPFVYPVYLSIQNPLDTHNIPPEVVDALEAASRRQRFRHREGLDMWHKKNRHPGDWVSVLKEDVAGGKNSHAWTSIPDWVTRTLQGLGYDGIRDRGGKNGGQDHAVWIPFDDTQVKSAIGNNGDWNPSKPSILASARDQDFYSALTRAVEGVKQAKGPPQQWRGILNQLQAEGKFKQEELDWSGVASWLETKRGPVEKQEIVDYLRANEIRIERVVYGESPDPNSGEPHDREVRWSSYTMSRGENAANYREYVFRMPPPGAPKFTIEGNSGSYYINRDGQRHAGPFVSRRTAVRSLDSENLNQIEAGGWAQYQHSSHWPGIGNPFAHARVEDRMLEDGKLALHSEELQSDAHGGDPDGKKYRRRPAPWNRRDILSPPSDLIAEMEAAKEALVAIEADRAALASGEKRGVDEMSPASRAVILPINKRRIQESSLSREERAQQPVLLTRGEQLGILDGEVERIKKSVVPALQSRIDAFGEDGGIKPNLPFKSSWPTFVLRRLLREAAVSGYDALTWTVGEDQARRYSLSQVVDKLAYHPDRGELWGVERGYIKKRIKVAPSGLDEYIGRDLANRMREEIDKAGPGDWSHIDSRGNDSRIAALREPPMPNLRLPPEPELEADFDEDAAREELEEKAERNITVSEYEYDGGEVEEVPNTEAFTIREIEGNPARDLFGNENTRYVVEFREGRDISESDGYWDSPSDAPEAPDDAAWAERDADGDETGRVRLPDEPFASKEAAEAWIESYAPAGWRVVDRDMDYESDIYDTEREAEDDLREHRAERVQWEAYDREAGDGEMFDSASDAEERAEEWRREWVEEELEKLRFEADRINSDEAQAKLEEDRAEWRAEVERLRAEHEEALAAWRAEVVRLKQARDALKPRDLPSLSGLSLEMGGEGKKNLYDRQVPAEIAKLLSKFKARARRDKLVFAASNAQAKGMVAPGSSPAERLQHAKPNKGTQEVWRIDITPEMRESLLLPQPLFSHRERIVASGPIKRSPRGRGVGMVGAGGGGDDRRRRVAKEGVGVRPINLAGGGVVPGYEEGGPVGGRYPVPMDIDTMRKDFTAGGGGVGLTGSSRVQAGGGVMSGSVGIGDARIGGSLSGRAMNLHAPGARRFEVRPDGASVYYSPDADRAVSLEGFHRPIPGSPMNSGRMPSETGAILRYQQRFARGGPINLSGGGVVPGYADGGAVAEASQAPPAAAPSPPPQIAPQAAQSVPLGFGAATLQPQPMAQPWRLPGGPAAPAGAPMAAPFAATAPVAPQGPVSPAVLLARKHGYTGGLGAADPATRGAVQALEVWHAAGQIARGAGR